MAKDGFGIILTLRYLNNKRFYANRREGLCASSQKKKERKTLFAFFCCKSAGENEKGLFAMNDR